MLGGRKLEGRRRAEDSRHKEGALHSSRTGWKFFQTELLLNPSDSCSLTQILNPAMLVGQEFGGCPNAESLCRLICLVVSFTFQSEV